MIGNQNDSKMIGFQNDWIPKWLDSKMIGFQNNRNGKMTTTMINKVNTMTPRQNDLVVKKAMSVIYVKWVLKGLGRQLRTK